MIILPIDAILQGQSYTRPQVDAALALKQNVLTFDDTPTANSNNPVKSGGIKTELDGKLPIAENQEQAPVGYVLTKTSTGSQWQRASSEGGTIAAAANSYPVTLSAANWSDHTYIIATPTGATITADCDGILGLAPNASAAQVEAFQLAKIVVTSQSTTGVTVAARGQVPTINLSLELTLFMKADYYTKTEEDALLATKAPLASPALTGTPTAPTAASGTNTTQIATTAFVQGELSAHGLDETGIEIPSTDNLDSYQTTGWYYWKGTAPSNPPADLSFCSMYVDHAYANIKQTVYRAARGTNTPATEWVRYKYSTGTWTTWVESPQGLSVVSLYYNSSGTTDVTSEVTVTLSDDMRNYKLIELYVTTNSTNASGPRSQILVEPRTLTAAFWYPFTNNGTNFYGVRLGLANNSTFTQLRFISTTAPALYLVQILGVR